MANLVWFGDEFNEVGSIMSSLRTDGSFPMFKDWDYVRDRLREGDSVLIRQATMSEYKNAKHALETLKAEINASGF
jgi:hypothetical protein